MKTRTREDSRSRSKRLAAFWSPCATNAMKLPTRHGSMLSPMHCAYTFLRTSHVSRCQGHDLGMAFQATNQPGVSCLTQGFFSPGLWREALEPVDFILFATRHKKRLPLRLSTKATPPPPHPSSSFGQLTKGCRHVTRHRGQGQHVVRWPYSTLFWEDHFSGAATKKKEKGGH